MSIMLRHTPRYDLRPVGGRLHKRYEATFEGGALPTWLTQRTSGENANYGSSTVTFESSSGIPDTCLLTTDSGASKRCGLRGPTVDMTKVLAAKLSIQCFGGGTTTPQKAVMMGIGNINAGSDKGVDMLQTDTGGTKFRTYKSGGPATQTDLAGIAWARFGGQPPRYCWDFWLTQDKQVLIGESGQIMHHAQFGAEVDLGDCFPYVETSISGGATAVSFRLLSMSFDVWYAEVTT